MKKKYIDILCIFSNCFVWVSVSTSDLKLHFLHEDTSADHPTITHVKNNRIFKGSGRANVKNIG